MRLSRRRLLGALPAALVPLLGRPARAAAFPRRLVIVHWTNGVHPSYWPSVVARDTDFVLTPPLQALERHRRNIVLLGGLGIPFKLSGHFTLPSLLTGAQPTPVVRTAGVGNGISLDQYVADAFARRSPTALRSLELGGVTPVRLAVFRSISFRGPAIGQRPRENPPEIDPYRVWARLFGAAGGDLARLRDERRSVLDRTAGELGALLPQLGGEDRARLSVHFEATRQLEREIAALPSAAACQPAPLPAGVNVRDALAADRLIAMQFDLLTLALRCDLTRVVTLMLFNAGNDGVGFPFLGPDFTGTPEPESPFEHHGIAHRGGPRKAVVDAWWLAQFGLLLDRLQAVPEGEGTLLDNTLVLFANQMADGAQHSVQGLPWIVAGRCQGAIRPGRYLVPPGWDPTRPADNCPPINQALVAIANAVLEGLEPPLDHFGAPELTGELPGLRG